MDATRAHTHGDAGGRLVRVRLRVRVRVRVRLGLRQMIDTRGVGLGLELTMQAGARVRAVSNRWAKQARGVITR